MIPFVENSSAGLYLYIKVCIYQRFVLFLYKQSDFQKRNIKVYEDRTKPGPPFQISVIALISAKKQAMLHSSQGIQLREVLFLFQSFNYLTVSTKRCFQSTSTIEYQGSMTCCSWFSKEKPSPSGATVSLMLQQVFIFHD